MSKLIIEYVVSKSKYVELCVKYIDENNNLITIINNLTILKKWYKKIDWNYNQSTKSLIIRLPIRFKKLSLFSSFLYDIFQ